MPILPGAPIKVYLLDCFSDARGNHVSVPVGEMKTDPMSGFMFFRYFERYLELGGRAIPVDMVNLPLKSTWQNMGRHGSTAIRDSAPDAWGRSVLKRCVDVRDFHELDYICFPNPARMGNLDFGKPCSAPSLQISELPKIQKIYEKIERLQDDESYLNKIHSAIQKDEMETLRSKFYAASIGGGRPKCVVEDGDGVLWIAKFPSIHDRRRDGAMEAASLALAEKCGINVCRSELRRIDGREVLFLKRFDRRPDGTRIGFMSAHSMLGMGKTSVRADDEYFRDYGLLAEKMGKYCLHADLEELFRRIVFNAIIRNRDDHERNHGFLIENGKMRLSPAYDIVPTGIDTDMSRPPMMSMRICGASNAASKKNLTYMAGAFGLSGMEAETVYDGIAETVRLAWRDTFAEFGLSEDDLGKSELPFLHLENMHAENMKPS